MDNIEELKSQLTRKTQECEELKKQLTNFMNSEYCKNCYELSEQLHRYKQVVKEIKKIAEKYVNNCNFSWGCEECSYECYSQQIIQKCEEVNK